MNAARAFESVSTWQQAMPEPASPERRAVLDLLAAEICAISDARLRVAIDGYTAAGKTTFGHELAAAIRRLGRSTLRASLDDFKKPWSDARAKGYDRTSADGYYRNAPDFASARDLLLEPAGPTGSGTVVLCAHDPLTGVDHRGTTVDAPTDGVLIVDSVFAFRPEYDDVWDFRIWLAISPELALQRGIERDTETEGRDEAERLHRDRYLAAERIYVREVDPISLADVVVDNIVFEAPEVVGRS